ncbi:MAG TPA: hypothetical protein PKA41_15170 [Verrucomicrobiota bacterium]|nr:hypothetical protein [Verrucomicrobiota bacterium]
MDGMRTVKRFDMALGKWRRNHAFQSSEWQAYIRQSTICPRRKWLYFARLFRKIPACYGQILEYFYDAKRSGDVLWPGDDRLVAHGSEEKEGLSRLRAPLRPGISSGLEKRCASFISVSDDLSFRSFFVLLR